MTDHLTDRPTDVDDLLAGLSARFGAEFDLSTRDVRRHRMDDDGDIDESPDERCRPVDIECKTERDVCVMSDQCPPGDIGCDNPRDTSCEYGGDVPCDHPRDTPCDHGGDIGCDNPRDTCDYGGDIGCDTKRDTSCEYGGDVQCGPIKDDWCAQCDVRDDVEPPCPGGDIGCRGKEDIVYPPCRRDDLCASDDGCTSPMDDVMIGRAGRCVTWFAPGSTSIG